MKLSQPLKLGLTLLGIMLTAGLGSGVVAYKIGYESLKGVNQPDINPTKKFTNNKSLSDRTKTFTPAKEQDIIKKVEIYLNDPKSKLKPSPGAKSADSKPSEEKKSETPPKIDRAVSFSLKTQVQGVTLEIVQTSLQGEDIWLNVQLKNEGIKDVNFLYSFLEIKDDRGQVLSAIIDGLPEELPATGETFTGTIKIPMALQEEERSFSIRLTDYPEQKLELNLANIPVQ